MKNLPSIFLSIYIVLTFGACPHGGGGYPAEIRGIGDSPNYPLEAAGFQRAEMMTYAPGLTNISTAYNLLSPDIQIAATIYSYKKGDTNKLDSATRFGNGPVVMIYCQTDYVPEKVWRQLDRYWSD